MPVDKTPLFRARVKMIRTQEAARLKRAQKQQQQQQQQQSQQAPSPVSSFDEKSPELEKQASSTSLNLNFLSYTAEAARIRQQLTTLRDMVISGRKEYVSDIGHSRRLIASYTDSMSDLERDELDAKIEKMMRDCIQSIQALQREVNSDHNLRALDEGPHLFEVLRILGKYLNGTAKIVAEMRALRTKKITNMRRTCRLATLAQLYSMKKRKEEMQMQQQQQQQSADAYSLDTISLKSDVSADSALSDSIIFGKEGIRRRGLPGMGMKKEGAKKPEEDGWSNAEVTNLMEAEEEAENVDALNNLDNDERTQLMAENERLYSRSLQVDSDIQKVEKQMTELYRLQETFAEKVSEQDRDINFVNETTILTVENIRAGNEQIRQAIQNMASRRVILLFCIIVLTFTLLFLDWYNP